MEDLNKKLEYFFDISKNLHNLYKSEQEIYTRVNNFQISYLDEYYKHYCENIGPGNLVRIAAIDSIRKGIKVDQNLIDGIIDKLLNGDLEYFNNLIINLTVKDYIHSSINEFKKNQFSKLWNKPWTLFFPLFYSYEKSQQVKEELEKTIVKELISRLGLENYKYTIFDFRGSNHTGGNSLGIAFYPNELKNHKHAYQIGLSFTDKIKAELYTGSEVKSIKVDRKFEVKNFEELGDKLLNIKVEADNLNKELLKTNTMILQNIWLLKTDDEKIHEFFSDNLIAINYDDLNLGDLNSYPSKTDIRNQIKATSKTTNRINLIYNFYKNIEIGDLVILASGNDVILGLAEVSSDYEFSINSKNYKHRRNVKWIKKIPAGQRFKDIKLTKKTLTNYTNNTNAKVILDFLLDKGNPIMSETKIKLPENAKNIIFYGPPGTGKTHFIQKELIPKFQNQTKSDTEYNNDIDINKFSIWQIITASLIKNGRSTVSDLLNDPLMVKRFENSLAKEPRRSLWAELGFHTVSDCENVNVTRRLEPAFFYKYPDSTWEIPENLIDIAKEEVTELLKFHDYPSQNISKHIVQEKRYTFVTFHQSFSYEDFVEGIKPVLSEVAEISDVAYELKKGKFLEIAERALQDKKKNGDKAQNYAIFIDEINRGNVANIFGELITLIEENKRGILSAKLTYSNEDFTVPENLYIYGTMNTADKSIEALDSALRRRFHFVELAPDPHIVKINNDKLESENIEITTIFEKINSRIERLLDKDHMLGHSYFLGIKTFENLKSVFKNNIIPLLQEYFYNDLNKISLILGKSFIERVDSKEVKLANGYENDFDNSLSVFRIKDIDKLLPDDFRLIYSDV